MSDPEEPRPSLVSRYATKEALIYYALVLPALVAEAVFSVAIVSTPGRPPDAGRSGRERGGRSRAAPPLGAARRLGVRGLLLPPVSPGHPPHRVLLRGRERRERDRFPGGAAQPRGHGDPGRGGHLPRPRGLQLRSRHQTTRREASQRHLLRPPRIQRARARPRVGVPARCRPRPRGRGGDRSRRPRGAGGAPPRAPLGARLALPPVAHRHSLHHALRRGRRDLGHAPVPRARDTPLHPERRRREEGAARGDRADHKERKEDRALPALERARVGPPDGRLLRGARRGPGHLPPARAVLP